MPDEKNDTRPLRQRVEDLWASDPAYPKEDWVAEVQNADTHLGYWEWVEDQIENGVPPAFDQTQAIKEGWTIMNNGVLNAAPMVERDDESDQFDTDYDALEFVALRALDGSDYHIAALQWIKKDRELTL